MVILIDQRAYLVEALNQAMPRLQQAFAQEGEGKQASLFLQHAITHHVDETSLAHILQEDKQEIAAAEGGLGSQIRWYRSPRTRERSGKHMVR